MDRQIRPLFAHELNEALLLAWQVFSDEIAAECDDAGINEVWSILDLEYNIQRIGDGELRFWGAFEGDFMVGMCAMRGLDHVHLLFVDQDFRFQDMGISLLKKALIDCKALDASISRITANAFSASRGFFETLGFSLCSEELQDKTSPFFTMEITSEPH